MQGIIFVLFGKFIREKYDYNRLIDIKKNADLENKFHGVGENHPDEEIFRLVGSASELLDISVNNLLERFGRFIGPELLLTYNSYIIPEWNSIDLLENIEKTMHNVVRISNPEALPPRLQIKRIDEKKVEINYTSDRKLSSLGEGIIYSIGDHYNEVLDVVKTDIDNGISLLVKKV